MLLLIHLDNLDFSVLGDYLVHLQLSEQRMLFDNSFKQDLKTFQRLAQPSGPNFF